MTFGARTGCELRRLLQKSLRSATVALTHRQRNMNRLDARARRRSKRMALVCVLIVFLVLVLARSLSTLDSSSVDARTPFSCTKPLLGTTHEFSVVVLTMERSENLDRLLSSIENSEYGGHQIRLEIHVDQSPQNGAVLALSHAFNFSHGEKVVCVSHVQLGLARSWFAAQVNISVDAHFIILEDDVTLSPHWFTWLRKMWLSYGHLPELAGITLQRQTLIPRLPGGQREIINGHQPFLYPLVGSIGFSPKPAVWKEFLNWVEHVRSDFDVSTPGLVTSEWWNKLDKRHMWTQHFIYFCAQRDYYTLYQNLAHSKTYAAHERTKGVHFNYTKGREFNTTFIKPSISKLPVKLQKFDWSGHEVNDTQNGFDEIVEHMFILQAQRMQLHYGFAYLMFVNRAYLQMTKSWICNIRLLNVAIFNRVLLVCSDVPTLRELSSFEPNLHSFLYRSEIQHGVDFGTFMYYSIVLERLKVQNSLIQHGVNVMIIESDQTWFRDVSVVIKKVFDSGVDVIAGDERAHIPEKMRSYICGGFHGISSNPVTKAFFRDYIVTHEKALSQYEGKVGVLPLENDQALLTRLVMQKYLQVRWLQQCEYVNGAWYTTSRRRLLCPRWRIGVLHNNYIVGNEVKEVRARKWGHWFLLQGTCATTQVGRPISKGD